MIFRWAEKSAGGIATMGEKFSGLSRKELIKKLEEQARLLTELKNYEFRHKNIQDVLQKKEKLLRAIFESTTDCVIVWDREYTCLYVNQAASQHVGAPPDRLLGKSIQDGLGHIPEFMELWRNRIDQVFKTGDPMRVKDVMPVVDKLVYSESTLSPVKGADRTLFAVAVVCRDVTESRQMERRIADTLALNEKIFEASSFGIIAYQDSGQAVMANEKAASIIGATRDQVLLQNFNDIESWKKTGLLDVARKTLATGTAQHHEIHTLSTFGREIWIVCRLFPFDAGGKAHLLLVFDDVAGYRKVEDLYKRLLDFSRAGVYRYSFDSGKILFANRGLVEILDLDCEPEDLLGRPLRTLLTYVEKEAFIRKHLDKKGEIHNFEYHFKTLKGDHRWVIHDSFLTVDQETGERMVESIVKDITGRKLMEHRLQHVDFVLRSLNNINQLIVKEKDSDHLLQKVCEQIVNIPRYHGIIIALWDTSGSLEAVAEAGLTSHLSVMGDNKTWCVLRALESPDLILLETPSEQCAGCPLVGEFANRGKMMIRLEHGDVVYGILAVTMDLEIAREVEEQELFEEIANNIAMALHNIELEQKRFAMKQALIEAKNKAQTYLDIAGVILMAIDTSGIVTLINKKGCEILGYPEEEIIGRNWFDAFIPEEQCPAARALLEKAPRDNGEFSEYFESAVLTREGTERIIAWHNVELKGETGAIIGFFSSGEDVTERRLTEKKYSSLYATMNEGVAVHEIVCDSRGEAIDYVITDVNPAYESIVGMTREEVINKKASQVYQAEGPPYLETYAGVAATGKPVSFTTYFPPMKKHFRISVFSPRPGAFATVFADITESKKAEEHIIQQRATVAGINKVLLETLTCETDEEVARKCLAVAEEMTGSAFGIITGIGNEGVFDIIALSDPAWPAVSKTGIEAATMIKMIKFMEKQELWSRDLDGACSILVNDPASHPEFKEAGGLPEEVFSFLQVPLKYEEQTFGMIILVNKKTGYGNNDREAIEALSVSFVEALYRKRYETALLESEERFQLVASATNDAVWDWDLITDRLRWNDAVHVLFGYREDEIGSDVYWREQCIHPAERDRVVAGIHEAVENGRSTWSDEYRFRRRNGSYSSILDRGFILYGGDGQPIRMIGSMLDMTELKKAQEALKETVEELERSNKELEQFAYIASHDLQEPLRKITVFGDRLSTYDRVTLDEKSKNYLERMQEAALRMKNLIQSLLAYSRVTTKARPFAAVPLEEVVWEILSDLEVKIEESGVQIDIGDLPMLAADRVQMGQLFQNLILNAIKFRKKNVKPRVIITSLPPRNGMYDILVEDNGIGFKMDYKDRIFKPFQRLHHRHEYEGVGMGLAICDKIVLRHGGQLSVLSELGKGSTFQISLPAG